MPERVELQENGADLELIREVLGGLQAPRKRLPPKLFYDAEGWVLFDRITALPEYYLTRTEAGILERHGHEVAALVGARPAVMIEPGCGASVKAAAILRHLIRPTFVGLDISGEALAEGARNLAALVPGLRVHPIEVDYTAEDWTVPPLPAGRRIAFFPGSTIGNFEPPDARAFLGRLARLVGADGLVVVGADLWKDPEVLRAAYDDSAGVTAAFNRNALAHLVRRFGADLDPQRFRHQVVVDPERRRVEMHLASIGRQTTHLGGRAIRFEDGETIHTESCYKWPIPEFHALARSAGLRPVRTLTDDQQRFALYVLDRA